MKKILLCAVIACGTAFIACNKNDDTTPAAASNGTLVASGMKVGYATKVTGSAPASSTSSDAPMLEQAYDYQHYYAIGGRYVVLYPHVYKGDVAGYYITVTGAGNYFKVDYAAAYGLKKANSKHSSLKGDDYEDSSIVIKLPTGLSTDSFSVRYAAYDESNNVSNYINAIVHVTSDADSTDNSKLAGTWRYNKERYFNNEDWEDSTVYNVDQNNTYDYFACVDGKLQYWWYYQDHERLSFINNITANQARDYTLGSGSQFSYHYQYKQRDLNWDLSSCSNLVYDNNDQDYTSIGGYYYNAASKTLTLIYDGNGERTGSDESGDGTNISNMYTTSFTVTSVSTKKLVLMQRRTDDGIYAYYYEFLKQ